MASAIRDEPYAAEQSHISCVVARGSLFTPYYNYAIAIQDALASFRNRDFALFINLVIIAVQCIQRHTN